MFVAAAIQMTSGADRPANEARALTLCAQAVERGANFVGLPEMWEHIGPAGQKTFAGPLEGAQLAALRDFARAKRVWVLAGSVAERAPDGRIFNTSALLSPRGEIAAAYRKLHLFDVEIPDGARYRESETVAPGSALAEVTDADGVRVALSVCYDLRFPELYRAADADLLCVPAAFTAYTGRAHWEVLLRARAIENQAFVLAPAQVGRIGPHDENRFAWGHACIVDPWGEVLADAGGEGEGIALAQLDLDRLRKVRRDLPALKHRRTDLFFRR